MPTPPEPPLKTEFLLHDARSGEQAAWREIYERYRTMMLVTIGSRLPGFLRRRFDAEDVLQNAFAKAYANLESFEYRGEGSFRRWLRQIVFHEFRNLLRAQEAERASVPCDTRALADGQGGENAPSQILSDIEAHEELLAQMDQLSEDDQELITMRVFEGMSWEDIGQVVGCSRTLASQRFNRTIGRLAVAMSGARDGAEPMTPSP